MMWIMIRIVMIFLSNEKIYFIEYCDFFFIGIIVMMEWYGCSNRLREVELYKYRFWFRIVMLLFCSEKVFIKCMESKLDCYMFLKSNRDFCLFLLKKLIIDVIKWL